MFKNIIKIFSNPLLYYSDKQGNSVFRNFCLFRNTGNSYHMEIPKSKVGKTLEYRFKLDKNLKIAYFITTLIVYMLFIHVRFSIWSLLGFEVLWIVLLSLERLWCSRLYCEFLSGIFGPFETVEFQPPISEKKSKEFLFLYKSKLILIGFALLLFFLPALLLQYGMKQGLNTKRGAYKTVVKLSNVYNSIYPKVSGVYDMRALANFMMRDYETSLNDYKKALELSGSKFSKRDYVRFENILYLQKKVTSSFDAVDIFNEYVTRKKMSVLEQAQMLWIKSIFKIENSIIDSIIQEYDDLLLSLGQKEVKNRFYISCDKAYMMSLMQQYQDAIEEYDDLISFATKHQKLFSKELQSLYAERGWAKKHLGDDKGAEIDFKTSDIPVEELKSYEPGYNTQTFVRENF